jgi:tRNA pseudouridine55 synthase
MNGILLIDKPTGLTSAEVVRRVKRGSRVKVGHLGTLDPFATGLLPLCLGEATKIAQFLNTADKRYEGVIRLGSATDTGDRTGRPIRTAAVPDLAAADLDGLARRFSGELLQTPPMYSALKRDGVPLYRLARQGVEVERTARPVRIDRLELRLEGRGQLRFTVACSKGTYVRVLAEDIGAALGSAAHLEALRRTAFGSFAIGDALALDAWDAEPARGLVTLRQALAHLPAVPIDRAAAAAVRQGQAWPLAHLPAALDRDAMLLDPAGEVVAVAVRRGRAWAYGRVLGAA